MAEAIMLSPVRKISIVAISVFLLSGILGAQTVVPIASSKNLPLNSPALSEYSAETRAILQDRKQRDAALDIAAAMRIKTEVEAQEVIDSILADANSAVIISDAKARARIRTEEAG